MFFPDSSCSDANNARKSSLGGWCTMHLKCNISLPKSRGWPGRRTSPCVQVLTACQVQQWPPARYINGRLRGTTMITCQVQQCLPSMFQHQNFSTALLASIGRVWKSHFKLELLDIQLIAQNDKVQGELKWWSRCESYVSSRVKLPSRPVAPLST